MEKRFDQVYKFLVKNGFKTEREIADGVGLKKTPYTRWLLFSLIASGHIARVWQEDRQPRPAYVYYVQETLPLESK